MPTRRLRQYVASMRPIILLLVLSLLLLATTGLDDGGIAGAGVTHASRDLPYVALTFDDGLNGQYTSAVADILDQYEMHGTFFIVGQTLAGQNTLAQQLMERGNLLGNHSYDHVRASPRDTHYFELERTQGEFKRTTGRCPRFFRPPFGAETPFTKAAVRRAGMLDVLWDVEVADWSETDPAQLARRVLASVRPGSIVLLHDGSDGHPGADRAVLLAALPSILAGLRERGVQSVTLDKLLNTSGYLAKC